MPLRIYLMAGIHFIYLTAGIFLKYAIENILDGRLGEHSENPAWWTRPTWTYSTRNYCTRCFHFSPKCTIIDGGPAWGAYSAFPDLLAVMGWDEDLITPLMGSIMCPLARDQCPLAVLRLAAGLGKATVHPWIAKLEMKSDHRTPQISPGFWTVEQK